MTILVGAGYSSEEDALSAATELADQLEAGVIPTKKIYDDIYRNLDKKCSKRKTSYAGKRVLDFDVTLANFANPKRSVVQPAHGAKVQQVKITKSYDGDGNMKASAWARFSYSCLKKGWNK